MFKIVFLCVANSVRSQIAEGLARKHLGDIAEIYSAGASPSGHVHEYALRVLSELQIDTTPLYSKGWSELPRAFRDQVDLVITVCGEEVCPMVRSGARHLHWPHRDPSSGLFRTENEVLDSFRTTAQSLELKILELRRELATKR